MRAPSNDMPHIVIAGAGPVGVVAALACAQSGFAVTLLEAEAAIDDSPRAATTHPSTLEMIARVGLIDSFIAAGLVARRFQFWDKSTHRLIAEFDHELLRGETEYPFVVQTEQHKLCNMGLNKLSEYPDVLVRFNAAVTGVSQDGDGVTVTIDGSNGAETVRGDYAIGADGGRSAVRKAAWKFAWSRNWRPVPDALPPVFLATAVESVIRAGEIQMAHFGSDLRVDKKGAIDLVTEIDLRVEREFRALIASRFPTHVVLGEELSEVEDRDSVPDYCWVFDPVDGTTNYATGCRSSVHRWRSRFAASRPLRPSTIQAAANCTRPSVDRVRG